MKVLTIKEPFATLIAKNIKHIETRSWKTNYRGEIYIHAGVGTTIDERGLEKGIELQNGYILCKCNLVDCIYMDEEFISNIKQTDEYLYGYYEVGRYAWVLDDIETIDKIKARGSLGIWNYYKVNEVMQLMDEISYGWIDKDASIHTDYDTFGVDYRLASPKMVQKYKVGVCFDQVELERYYLRGHNIKTYFITYKDIATHTFMVIEENNKYYWFEHAWEKYRGIYEYNTIDELLKDVINKFKSESDYDNVELYEYSKPQYGISATEFIDQIKRCN